MASDASDVRAYTDVLMRARVETLRYCEFTSELTKKPVRPIAWAASLGVRETWHARCVHQVAGADLLGGHHPADAIAWGTYPIDVHHAGGCSCVI